MRSFYERTEIPVGDRGPKNFFKKGHVSTQTTSQVTRQAMAWMELMDAERDQGFELVTKAALPDNFNQLDIDEVQKLSKLMEKYKAYTLGERCRAKKFQKATTFESDGNSDQELKDGIEK